MAPLTICRKSILSNVRTTFEFDEIISSESKLLVVVWERKFDAINSWSKFSNKPDIDSANVLGGEEEFCCKIVSLWDWTRVLKFRLVGFLFVVKRFVRDVTGRGMFDGAGANGRPWFGTIETRVGLFEDDADGFLRLRTRFLVDFLFVVDGIDKSKDFEWINCGEISIWFSIDEDWDRKFVVDGEDEYVGEENNEIVGELLLTKGDDGLRTFDVVDDFGSLTTTGVQT